MAKPTADLLTDDLHAQLVDAISRASDDDWRAAAWLLERGWPDQWRLRPLRRSKPADPDAPSTADVSGTTEHDPFTEVDELAARRRS